MSAYACKPVYWTGPLDKCQMCGGDFVDVMYDFRTENGQWGNGCGWCFKDHRGALGVGRGQKYCQQDDGRWLKVEG